MYVLLDASVLISEDFGKSARMQLLLSSSSVVGHTICIPALAIEEVYAKYRKVLDSEVKKVRDSLRGLSRQLGELLNSPISDLDVAAKVSLFREILEAQFTEPNCDILDYPDVSHNEMVKRAVARRRPFDDKGSGFRDALIWYSILQLAKTVGDEIVLVSLDNDFAGADKKLHSDLTDELVECGHSKDKVILVQSLADFIDTYVRPNLKSVVEDSPKEALAEWGLDLEEAIALAVQDTYAGEEWSPEQLGLQWEYETLHLDIVEQVDDFEVVEVREVSNSQYLIRIKSSLECSFDAFVFKADTYIMDDLRIVDFDWNDHYALATVSLPLLVEIDLLIDLSDSEHNIKVLSMEPANLN